MKEALEKILKDIRKHGSCTLTREEFYDKEYEYRDTLKKIFYYLELKVSVYGKNDEVTIS